VRLRVETLARALVIPTSAVQRGPAGTFSYVIGEDDIVGAKPVVVTQQNETDAVISGLSTSDRVVTTGFANLSDGAKVVVGKDEQAPTADLAPHRRNRGERGGQGKDAQGNKEWQGRDWQGRDGQGERRGKRGERHQGENDQRGQTGPAHASEPAQSTAKSQP
jgi:multidrug efflux system membrane fusion protein